MKSLLSVSLLALCCFVSEAATRPNVLFIISDDLTATALSCYGNIASGEPAQQTRATSPA